MQGRWTLAEAFRGKDDVRDRFGGEVIVSDRTWTFVEGRRRPEMKLLFDLDADADPRELHFQGPDSGEHVVYQFKGTDQLHLRMCQTERVRDFSDPLPKDVTQLVFRRPPAEEQTKEVPPK